MFENPKSTPSNPSSTGAKESVEHLVDALSLSTNWREHSSLAHTLQQATTLLECFVGPTATLLWSDEATRVARLVVLVGTMGEHTFAFIQAHRESEPEAARLLKRFDEALRDAIPKLTTHHKGRLLISGYPLGSGKDSLADLCVSSELAARGAPGVLKLFSLCAGSRQPPGPWGEDLLQAANTALKSAHSKFVDDYLVGFKSVFPTASPWASRADELLAGTSATVPFDTLIKIYERIRMVPKVALEAKRALLRALVDSIDSVTGGCVREELTVIKQSDRLPVITVQAIHPILRISRSLAEGDSHHSESITTLKKLLKRWHGRAAPISEDVPSTADPKSVSAGIPVEGGEAKQRPKASRRTNEGKQKKATDNVAACLSKLKDEALSRFIAQGLVTGLRDPDSTMSKGFLNALEHAPLEQLLPIRKTLMSSEDIPPQLGQKVEERIQHELTTSVPTLETEKMVLLYGLYREVGGYPDEERTVRNLLRKRLRLPIRDEEQTSNVLSTSGQRVWGWIFSATPPDAHLLADFIRTHFDRVMARVAREIPIDGQRGSILDALLPYAQELRLLKSYKPGPLLSEVPTWRLIVLTAQAQQELGDRDGVVTSLVDALCTRLTTRGPSWHDDFPIDWHKGLPVRRINNVADLIQAKVCSLMPTASFEEVTFLVNNMHLIGRRGPNALSQLSRLACKEFVQQFKQQDLRRLREIDNGALKGVIQALAASNYRALHVLGVLSEECVHRANSLSPVEFADIAQALAELRAGDSRFWSAFASHVDENWDTYRAHGDEDEALLVRLWGLALMAPDKMTDNFNRSVIEGYTNPAFQLRVVQTLIALGRYTPDPNDHLFQRLTTSLDTPKVYAHERIFLDVLPSVLGIPKSAIFVNVVVGGFETDFVVDLGTRRLIIELDGPRHFLLGPQGGIRRGRDEFQDIVFKRLGYEVFHYATNGRSDVDANSELLRELAEFVRSIKATTPVDGAARQQYLEELPRGDE